MRMSRRSFVAAALAAATPLTRRAFAQTNDNDKVLYEAARQRRALGNAPFFAHRAAEPRQFFAQPQVHVKNVIDGVGNFAFDASEIVGQTR